MQRQNSEEGDRETGITLFVHPNVEVQIAFVSDKGVSSQKFPSPETSNSMSSSYEVIGPDQTIDKIATLFEDVNGAKIATSPVAATSGRRNLSVTERLGFQDKEAEATARARQEFVKQRARGLVSPLNQLKLPPDARARVGIPENAEYFAFVHPAQQMAALLIKVNIADYPWAYRMKPEIRSPCPTPCLIHHKFHRSRSVLVSAADWRLRLL